MHLRKLGALLSFVTPFGTWALPNLVHRSIENTNETDAQPNYVPFIKFIANGIKIVEENYPERVAPFRITTEPSRPGPQSRPELFDNIVMEISSLKVNGTVIIIYTSPRQHHRWEEPHTTPLTEPSDLKNFNWAYMSYGFIQAFDTVKKAGHPGPWDLVEVIRYSGDPYFKGNQVYYRFKNPGPRSGSVLVGTLDGQVYEQPWDFVDANAGDTRDDASATKTYRSKKSFKREAAKTRTRSSLVGFHDRGEIVRLSS